MGLNVRFRLLGNELDNDVRCFGHEAASVLGHFSMPLSLKCSNCCSGVNSVGGGNIRVSLGCVPIGAEGMA